ncbi:unnamed protein product [Peronospora belbahrii]|uniref:Uncharacterized protein n=1 Tax=Peronospora belbahrii TaxID=622444 RepID=A0AAU9L109_9STRA|nr:unnamed protein product [Peronospora belbahrii]
MFSHFNLVSHFITDALPKPLIFCFGSAISSVDLCRCYAAHLLNHDDGSTALQFSCKVVVVGSLAAWVRSWNLKHA